nr:hypothetical protein [Tanacetum cinerariifolium]
MTESPLVDSSLAHSALSLRDDPIACFNKAMAFLTVVASSRFPSTNNQLRTSFNSRNQATIQDGYQNLFYLKKAQRIKPTLYDEIIISDKHVVVHVIDDEETLILEEVKLNQRSKDFGKHFTPQQELLVKQAFWFRISNPTIESSDKPPVKVDVPSELPKELLVYVRDTCPNAIKLSAKKVAATPKTKIKKVRIDVFY